MEPRVDPNRPFMVRVPKWGPDGYSRRTAVRNALWSNPVWGALTGVGVRPAPIGSSQTEGVKTDALLPIRQQTRGAFLVYVANPTIKNVPNSASFPAANVAVNPILETLGSRIDRGRWS